MSEADNRTEPDGKGLFVIRNGQKIAKYEAGKWVPLLPGVVVRTNFCATRRVALMILPRDTNPELA